MQRLFILACMFVCVSASADFSSSDDSRYALSSANVSIIKQTSNYVEEEATYVFKYCVSGTLPKNCETIGSEDGYTLEQINELSGRWKQFGAVALGAGEGVVGVVMAVYIGSFTVIGSTAALGTGGLGTTTGLVGGTVLGITVPVAIVNFFEGINPFRIYDEGKVEHQLKRSVNELLQSGDASLVIYQDTDIDEVLSAAEQVEDILFDLEE